MTTHRKFPLQAGAGGNAVGFVDISRICSRENHRLYRQGRNYCARVSVDPSSSVNYTVYALRDDWQVHNAWKLAMQTWMNNSKEEREVLAKNGGQARWSDFRTVVGISGTGTTELRSGTYTITGGTPVWVANTNGEFVASEIVSETGTNYFFTWGAAAPGGSYSILEEYDKVANTDTTPTIPQIGAAYTDADEDLQDTQLQNISNDGNNPPYSATGIESNRPWTKIATIGAGGVGQQALSTGYFNAPCGLVVIVANTQWDGNQQEVMLELKEGKYKGIHAPSMGTAKLVKNHYEVK